MASPIGLRRLRANRQAIKQFDQFESLSIVHTDAIACVAFRWSVIGWNLHNWCDSRTFDRTKLNMFNPCDPGRCMYVYTVRSPRRSPPVNTMLSVIVRQSNDKDDMRMTTTLIAYQPTFCSNYQQLPLSLWQRIKLHVRTRHKIFNFWLNRELNALKDAGI